MIIPSVNTARKMVIPNAPTVTPGRRVMPAHGWIFSCLSSIPMNCSIRRARVSAFFAV
jgi:hypothetical protein